MALSPTIKGKATGEKAVSDALRGLAEGKGSATDNSIRARFVLRDIAKEVIMPALAAASPRSRGHNQAWRRKHGKVPMYTTMAMNENTKGRYGKGGVLGIRIGPKYPEAAQAHLTEAGTGERFTFARNAKGGKVLVRSGFLGMKYRYERDKEKGYRGKMLGTHWILRAWEKIEGSVVAQMAERFQRYLQEDIARAAAKIAGAK